MLRDRLPALLALAIPVLAGAAWMAASGAPAHFPLINLGVLAAMLAWIAFGRGPHTAPSRHILAAVLLVVMLSAVLVGPQANAITGHAVYRWFPVGSVNLHTGMIAVPPLVILAARNRSLAAPLLLFGIGAALIQPDAASGFALTFAAVGLHHVTRDWRVGLAAIAGFFASLAMSVRGELPPQPFVEGVLVEAAIASVPAGLALAASLGIGFALILFAIPYDRAKRFALAGALFGFGVIALMAPYPTPLIGYGAAPILGFGIAMGLHRIPLR